MTASPGGHARTGTTAASTLALAFTGALLAVGLPYWRIHYAQVALPDAVWGAGLLVVAALAAWPRVVSGVGFWRATLVVGAAVPTAVLARVVVDVASDATSHNLWPFELILSAGPGWLASAAGALAGGLVARTRGASR